MSPRWFILGIFLLMGRADAAEDILSTVRDTHSNDVYDYKVDSDTLARIPHWSGPPQDIPFAIDDAIRSALKKAKEEDIEVGPLKYVGLAKRILPGDRHVWAYSISFRTSDDQHLQSRIFIVLLDGSVILPTKRKQ